MEIKLSKATAKIKDALTWGDIQKIKTALMSSKENKNKEIFFSFDAVSLLESKYVALECAVLEIKEGDKTELFSREWMDNLSIEDGDKLYNSVDLIAKKK